MPAAKFEIKRKCKICGQEFIAKTIESWYCSKRCSNIAYKRRKDEEKRNQRLDEIVKAFQSTKIISRCRKLMPYLVSAKTHCIDRYIKVLSRT